MIEGGNDEDTVDGMEMAPSEASDYDFSQQ